MIQHLGWESLIIKRTESRLTMMYKVIRGIVEAQQQYLVAEDSRTPGTSKFLEIIASKDVTEGLQGRSRKTASWSHVNVLRTITVRNELSLCIESASSL